MQVTKKKFAKWKRVIVLSGVWIPILKKNLGIKNVDLEVLNPRFNSAVLVFTCDLGQAKSF